MGSGKITADTGVTAWSPIILASIWGIAKEKGVLLQIEVRVNLLWVVKEVRWPEVLDEDYVGQLWFWSNHDLPLLLRAYEENCEKRHVKGVWGLFTCHPTPLEKNLGDLWILCPFCYLGSVPSTPGELPSGLPTITRSTSASTPSITTHDKEFRIWVPLGLLVARKRELGWWVGASELGFLQLCENSRNKDTWNDDFNIFYPPRES